MLVRSEVNKKLFGSLTQFSNETNSSLQMQMVLLTTGGASSWSFAAQTSLSFVLLYWRVSLADGLCGLQENSLLVSFIH